MHVSILKGTICYKCQNIGHLGRKCPYLDKMPPHGQYTQVCRPEGKETAQMNFRERSSKVKHVEGLKDEISRDYLECVKRRRHIMHHQINEAVPFLFYT
jgi:hypothetical protein